MSRSLEMTLMLIVALVAIVGVIYISRWRVGRAMREVVRLFRASGATSPAAATTPFQLGIVPRSLLSPRFGARDYKPQALRMLTQVGVIKTSAEGGLYLSEEELAHSPLKKMAKIE